MRTKTTLKIITGTAPLVPLVDVFFILLVFFMISNSLVFWPGSKVETSLRLPQARTSSLSEADKLVVTVTRAGQVFFNDNSVSWDELALEINKRIDDLRKAALHRADLPAGTGAEGVRQPMLVLRADKEISYGQFFEIISIGRSLGADVWLVSDSSAGGVGPGSVLGGDLD